MNPEELYEIANIGFKDSMGYKKLNIWAVEKEVGEFLYYLVKLIKPKIIVETGSGFSTLSMANALSENEKGHIYSFDIDTKTASGRASQFNVLDLKDYVTLINGSAKDKFDEILNVSCVKISTSFNTKISIADKEKIDFAFFDANHTYESVIEEFQVFKPYFKKGSYLAFHDSTHPKFINKVGKAIEDIGKEIYIEKISFETAFGVTIAKII